MVGNALGRLFDTYTYVSYKKDGSELPPGKDPHSNVAGDLVIDQEKKDLQQINE